MTRKEQLLVWELENKQLDVEIKEEQLHQAKLKSGELRKQIETSALLRYDKELSKTVEYQHGQIQRLRQYLVAKTKELNFSQDRARELFNESVDLKKELESLQTTKAVRFVLWLRKLVNPSRKNKGFSPVQLNREPTSLSSIRNLSPEVLAMSADEFKTKYIDSEIL